MAYLSDYEQDVFVSYSHGDPRGTGALKKWTFELLRTLKGDILDIDPEFGDLVIWWDEDLDPTAQLTPGTKSESQILGNSAHRHVAALSGVALVQR